MTKTIRRRLQVLERTAAHEIAEPVTHLLFVSVRPVWDANGQMADHHLCTGVRVKRVGEPRGIYHLYGPTDEWAETCDDPRLEYDLIDGELRSRPGVDA